MVQLCDSSVAVSSQEQDFLSTVLQRQVRWGHPTEKMEMGGKIILFTREKGIYLSFSFNYEAHKNTVSTTGVHAAIMWKKPAPKSEFPLKLCHNIYSFRNTPVKNHYLLPIPRPFVLHFNIQHFSAHEEIFDVFFSIASPKSELRMQPLHTSPAHRFFCV